MPDFRVKIEQLDKSELARLLGKHSGELGCILAELGYTRSGPMYARLRNRASDLGIPISKATEKKVVSTPSSTSLLPPGRSAKKRPDAPKPSGKITSYQDVIDRLETEIRELEDEIAKRRTVQDTLRAL